MNRTRKVDLLHKVAHGQGFQGSAEEKRELKKYKVTSGDGRYATKANLSAYISEVNSGYRLSFYDWAMNNCKADRRRKGSSEAEMAQFNRDQGISVVLMGWLIWGIAIYWMFHGSLGVGACAVAGAVVALILFKIARNAAGFTQILLPCILAVIFFKYL